MSEQSIDAVFARFDVDFDVNIERRERFDVVDAIVSKVTNEVKEFLVCFENVTDLDIEIFVVVLKKIDEIVDKIVDEILFFFLLKFRFETTLIISFFIDFV